MYRCQSENHARELARSNGLYYGFCVVDGLYYVGTVAQLKRLPVIISEVDTDGNVYAL
jgi:hypothetical protein